MSRIYPRHRKVLCLCLAPFLCATRLPVQSIAAAAAAAPMIPTIGAIKPPADFGSLLHSLITLDTMLSLLPFESRYPVFALFTSEPGRFEFEMQTRATR